MAINLNNRENAEIILGTKFIEDFESVLKELPLEQKIEICGHFLDVFDKMSQINELHTDAFRNEKSDIELKESQAKIKEIYKRFIEQEEKLLQRFGAKLKPYTTKKFYIYFDYELALIEKDIIDQAHYKKLSYDKQSLSKQEMARFIRSCNNVVYNKRNFLYLERSPEFKLEEEPKKQLKEEPENTETDKEITRSRQLLAYYFLFKAAFAVEHRNSHSVSEIVKFIHFLSGTKFTSLQSSNIYKMYKEIPDYKSGELLIKDLKYIRTYFETLGLKSVLVLIDDKLTQTINKLTPSQKKKYQ